MESWSVPWAADHTLAADIRLPLSAGRRLAPPLAAGASLPHPSGHDGQRRWPRQRTAAAHVDPPSRRARCRRVPVRPRSRPATGRRRRGARADHGAGARRRGGRLRRRQLHRRHRRVVERTQLPGRARTAAARPRPSRPRRQRRHARPGQRLHAGADRRRTARRRQGLLRALRLQRHLVAAAARRRRRARARDDAPLRVALAHRPAAGDRVPLRRQLVVRRRRCRRGPGAPGRERRRGAPCASSSRRLRPARPARPDRR